jgi:hypothetical protein
VKIVQPQTGRRVVVTETTGRKNPTPTQQSPRQRQVVLAPQPKKVIKIQIAKKKQPQQQQQTVISRQTQVYLAAPQAAPQVTKKQQQPQSSLTTSQSHSLKSSVATASAIARDPKHPKRDQAEELVRAYQRGWVDAIKFNEILQQLVF